MNVYLLWQTLCFYTKNFVTVFQEERNHGTIPKTMKL